MNHICGRRYGYAEPEDTYEERDGALRCSYCGSLSPEDFFRLVEDGAEVGPTDKSYKVYVTHPSVAYAKFYFQHLSLEEQKRFIALYNEKRMKIGYPGHFYTRPFFATWNEAVTR